MKEGVETEDQNKENGKDHGSVSIEGETNGTEVSKVVENINGETQVVEEKVRTETKKKEQKGKVESGEEVMLVDGNQSSVAGIVTLEDKQQEKWLIRKEGRKVRMMLCQIYQMCQIYLRWDVNRFILWKK